MMTNMSVGVKRLAGGVEIATSGKKSIALVKTFFTFAAERALSRRI
jgi:hypothetical protein